MALLEQGQVRLDRQETSDNVDVEGLTEVLDVPRPDRSYRGECRGGCDDAREEPVWRNAS